MTRSHYSFIINIQFVFICTLYIYMYTFEVKLFKKLTVKRAQRSWCTSCAVHFYNYLCIFLHTAVHNIFHNSSVRRCDMTANSPASNCIFLFFFFCCFMFFLSATIISLLQTSLKLIHAYIYTPTHTLFVLFLMYIHTNTHIPSVLLCQTATGPNFFAMYHKP